MILNPLRILLALAVSALATPRDTIVLLIDFQHDFASSNGAWPASPELSATTLASAGALVHQAHTRGWLVVRVANAFHPRDPGNLFRKHAAIRGRPGARWILPDTLLQGPLFPKTGPDGFGSKDLEDWFAQHPASVVWVAGYFTEGCVLSTARSALRRGHVVVSSPHLVASVDSASWRKGWERLRQMGVLEGMHQRSGHTE